jgi:hypothetical protein
LTGEGSGFPEFSSGLIGFYGSAVFIVFYGRAVKPVEP